MEREAAFSKFTNFEGRGFRRNLSLQAPARKVAADHDSVLAQMPSNLFSPKHKKHCFFARLYLMAVHYAGGMKTQAIYYFNPQDYTACKELREVYMNEADGDARRAMLALCIDMAALDAYVTDIEQLAIRHGIDVTTIMTARPFSPRSASFRLPPRISPEKGLSRLPPEVEWADEVRRRMQAWTGHQSSPARTTEFGVPQLIEPAS
jgi:hypothetical protein